MCKKKIHQNVGHKIKYSNHDSGKSAEVIINPNIYSHSFERGYFLASTTGKKFSVRSRTLRRPGWAFNVVIRMPLPIPDSRDQDPALGPASCQCTLQEAGVLVSATRVGEQEFLASPASVHIAQGHGTHLRSEPVARSLVFSSLPLPTK